METIIEKEGPQTPPKSKPLCNYQCPQESIVEKLFNYKSKKTDPCYQIAADLFVIRYLVGGVDPVALITLKWKNWKGDIIIIGTQNMEDAITEVVVTEELSNRMLKYANKNIMADEYIFPFVGVGLEEQIQSFITNINRYLGKIAEELHIDKFPFYDAKRTWIH